VTGRRLYLLLSPGFLLALLLLILNDHVLKYTFHNSLTGKLSDLVGLFAFSVFWLALFDRQKSREILVVIGVLFFVWKTELSEPFIHLINGISPLDFDRVVDYSDLCALLMLPVASWYVKVALPLVSSQMAPIGIGVLSLVAFVATSKLNTITYNEEARPTYEFTETAWTVVLAINEHFDPDPLMSFSFLDVFRQKEAETRILFKKSCIGKAHILVREQGESSEVLLIDAAHRCTSLGREPEKIRGKDGPVSDAFEKGFIEELRKVLAEQKVR
jgi:hypothetical protein